MINLDELYACAVEQGYSIDFGDWIGIDLITVLRLKEIQNED